MEIAILVFFYNPNSDYFKGRDCDLLSFFFLKTIFFDRFVFTKELLISNVKRELL